FIGAIAVNAGTGLDTLTVTSGSLPTGLKASLVGSTITFSGKPTVTGTYNFTLKLTDSLGSTGSQSYPIIIDPATTLVWTGLGGVGNENWSDPVNWSGAAPVTGDRLIFGAGAAQQTANNDLVNGSFAAIVFQAGGYTITGNAIKLTGATSIST